MRRGSLLACVVIGAVGLSGVTGCKALYGGKPEKMVNPTKKKRPPEPPDETVAVKYIEECVTSFRDDPKTAPAPQKKEAQQALTDGDAATQQALRATDVGSQLSFHKTALERYRTALSKDPYNTEATLKLAVAYDTLMRKGCALALLKRIGDMKRHPRFQQAARATASDVAGNATWFRGYRSDAIAAVGE